MCGRRVRSLKTRVERKCCIRTGRPDGPSSTVEVYKLEESEEEVTVFVGVGSPEEAGMQQVGRLQE